MWQIFRQFFFIPTPPITGLNCPDQTGRVCISKVFSTIPNRLTTRVQVFIITGGYGGIGFELSQILYEHNATVYIAGRSQSKASNAISNMIKASPKSSGRLEFLFVDLMDLATIKSSAEAFLTQEERLDVLVHNAGVSRILKTPINTSPALYVLIHLMR